MITHIVLLKPKGETTEQEIDAALEGIRKLQDSIPVILNVRVGKNLNGYSEKNKGYTHGFTMRFANKDDLGVYAVSPIHRAAGNELRRVCESIIDFDLPIAPYE